MFAPRCFKNQNQPSKQPCSFPAVYWSSSACRVLAPPPLCFFWPHYFKLRPCLIWASRTAYVKQKTGKALLGKLTFLDFVAEQVDLLSSGHAAGGPIHPHDLQVGGVRSLWGRKEKQLLSEIYLPEASSRATHLQRGGFFFCTITLR